MASKARESYLKQRGRVYWFRLAVPRKLRAVMGKLHIEESLGTDSREEANRLKHRRLDHWLGEFKRLEKAPAVPAHLRDAAMVRQALPAHSEPDEGHALWYAADDHAEALGRKDGPGSGSTVSEPSPSVATAPPCARR